MFLPLRWLSAASTLIGLAWITLVASMTYPPYHRLRQALERGRCAVLEGAIADFHPGGTSGRSTTESFTVSGVPFSYSAFEMSPGFNQTAAVNGPLHEGLRVRIHAYQGAIARLEIFEERTAR